MFPPLHCFFIYLTGTGSLCVSCSRSFCPSSFICKCSTCNDFLFRFKSSSIGTPSILDHSWHSSQIDILLFRQVMDVLRIFSSGSVHSHTQVGPRWCRFRGMPTLNPGCVPGWQLSWLVQPSGNTSLRWGVEKAVPVLWWEMGQALPSVQDQLFC